MSQKHAVQSIHLEFWKYILTDTNQSNVENVYVVCTYVFVHGYENPKEVGKCNCRIQ